ncbi:DUF6308 family protein [Rhodococcus sp. T7]|uniref:DUF6308 family protein n=1 Tax=Rhodococcus sp. T7 TaxID=627444 RepID=UPI001F2C6A8F|nr:DUF6308 family protein [Rhodococcus sp. T7]
MSTLYTTEQVETFQRWAPRQASAVRRQALGRRGVARSRPRPGRDLHRRLLSIQEEAGLPEEISALRVFDVIARIDPSAAAPKNALT